MKSMNILLGTVSLACLAAIASATDARTQALDAATAQRQEANQNQKDISLPPVFFKVDKSAKGLSTQTMSPAEALEKAFRQGKTPTKADLLDYSVGIIIYNAGGTQHVVMSGFGSRPEGMPGELFDKEVFLRVMNVTDWCAKTLKTAAQLDGYEVEFAKLPCHGPTKFSDNGAFATNPTPHELLQTTWHFRVYERYLLAKEMRKGVEVGIGYFYKKLK